MVIVMYLGITFQYLTVITCNPPLFLVTKVLINGNLQVCQKFLCFHIINLELKTLRIFLINMIIPMITWKMLSSILALIIYTNPSSPLHLIIYNGYALY